MSTGELQASEKTPNTMVTCHSAVPTYQWQCISCLQHQTRMPFQCQNATTNNNQHHQLMMHAY